MVTAARTFDSISRQARYYPSYLLKDQKTALALFAAGFLGWNDVVHFARARLICTCVDVDQDNLFEMARVYPDGWEFRAQDAWEFAERATEAGRQWDVMSIDPFFESCAQKVWDSIDMFLPLARNLITLTVHRDTEVETPGWTQSYFSRGENVGWMVMKRA